MATWKSKDSVKFDRDMGMDYAKCENSWSYGTVADVLTVETKVGEYSDFNYHPPTVQLEHFGKADALAMLETLMDWANTYEGSQTVQEIFDRVKKEK